MIIEANLIASQAQEHLMRCQNSTMAYAQAVVLGRQRDVRFVVCLMTNRVY